MANAYKVLAQSNPSAATLTEIYDCPDATEAVISTIVVCNRSSAETSFRISIQLNNAADDNSQYLYYDLPIDGNESFESVPITINADDRINVYAEDATLTFTVLGVEIT